MKIITVFKESIAAAKGNPLIFVPMLASIVFSAIISLIFAGSAMPMMSRFSGEQIAANPEQALAGAGAAAGSIMFVSIIGSFVSLLAHGMTVGMADIAFKGESVTLKTGWMRLVSRIVPLVIATIVVVIIVTFGMILLVLPGLIAAFLLIFTLIAVMLDNLSAWKALGRSVKTVKKNFGAVLITFLVIIGLTFLVGILNFVVVFIPILGAILSIIIFSIYTAFITILLVRVYQNLDVQTDTSPEVET
ncbi:MAG: hypothetical protein U5P10_09425 [Spirochaetia bacterium]|nr:hypothetical protein [Spirochaetia bacterium]